MSQYWYSVNTIAEDFDLFIKDVPSPNIDDILGAFQWDFHISKPVRKTSIWSTASSYGIALETPDSPSTDDVFLEPITIRLTSDGDTQVHHSFPSSSRSSSYSTSNSTCRLGSLTRRPFLNTPQPSKFVNRGQKRSEDRRRGESLSETECRYCRSIKKPYRGHNRFTCPVLCGMKPCSICGASGYKNHTISHCPKAPSKELELKSEYKKKYQQLKEQFSGFQVL